MQSAANRPINISRANVILSGLIRAILFAILWWSFTEGQLPDWKIGLPTVLLATGASLTLLPPGGLRWRITGLLRFLPFFLWQSVLGGTDVARRAVYPSLPIDPVFMDFPVRLPSGSARILLANTMSLLPGTLSVELRENELRLHLLDRRMPVLRTLRATEEHIARIFGLDLPPPPIPDTGREVPNPP